MATAKKQKDGSWRIQPCVTVHGEKRRTNIRAASKREAEQLALEWVESQGKPKPKTDLTVREAVFQFIKNRESVFSPSTIRGYNSIANSGIPGLMDMKLTSVTPEILQKEVDNFSKTRSPKTVANNYDLIISAMRAASYDIPVEITLPAKRQTDIRVPSHDEVSVFMKHAQGKRIYIPMMLALFCGLRESEVAALKLKNIFMKEKVCFIRVEEALVQGPAGAELKQPKSFAGYREIPLHQDFCQKLIEAAKENKDGRVTTFTSKQLSNAWIDFSSRVDVEHVTFHALRHFYASNALLNNVPIDYVVAMMGHSSRAMVERVYKHIFPESQFEFAARIVNEYERYLNT